MKSAPQIKAATNVQPLVGLLNQALADTIDLKLASKQAHWNVRGPAFIALHELFDKVSAEVDGYVDVLAERVAQLGGTAQGTLQQVAQRSALPPYPAATHDSREHVQALGAMTRAVADGIRHAIGQTEAAEDAVTVDILTEAARGLDKLRWFIESHISD